MISLESMGGGERAVAGQVGCAAAASDARTRAFARSPAPVSWHDQQLHVTPCSLKQLAEHMHCWNVVCRDCGAAIVSAAVPQATAGRLPA